MPYQTRDARYTFNAEDFVAMSIPTVGETYSQMMEHVRKAQESAAMMAHLLNAEGKTQRGIQWLAVSENLKKMQHLLIQLAQGRMQ